MKHEMTMEEIQKDTLVILAELDRICMERQYKYWISYGTLIGAVRHGGFIPWDDDIDIAMPRGDYDALIRYLDTEYRNPMYELHTYENNEKYPFYIARFCDKSHTLEFDDYDYSSGCFVDIYPYDGLGNDDDMEYWKKQEPAIYRAEKRVVMSMQNKWFYGSNFLHKIWNFPQLLLCKVIGKNSLFERLDDFRKKYSWHDSKYVGMVCWESGIFGYQKDWFESLERMMFEGIYVNVPKEYDKILRFRYGDYMQLPPISERMPQHGYTAYKH